METDYFKRLQGNGIYHFIKVVGGPGKNKDGYQEVINFLNDTPIISLEKNSDSSGLTGTWCNWEVGEIISEQEYKAAYQKATQGKFEIY